MEGAESSSHPGGAALCLGAQGWVLAEEHPDRSLGRALAWGRQHAIHDLHLVVGSGSCGVSARRAVLLDPSATVWAVRDRTLVRAEQAPPVAPPGPEPAALKLAAVLEQAGADVVIEHGTVMGEVLGLEVARVVVSDGGDARIEVGVGRHDREAFALLHGDLPQAAALASVIDAVRRHRTPAGPSHPLRSLAGERWLRARLIADPSIIGAHVLAAAEGPEPRMSVKEPQPAVAVGQRPDGSPVVAVTSVGVDLELVPYAADARAMHDPAADLVVAVPARDALAVTIALAAMARPPARVVAIEGDWRGWTS